MFFLFGFFELFLTFFFVAFLLKAFKRMFVFFIVFGDSLFCQYCDAM